jgi:N-acetylglucosaminyldiphosphoundecaprenol N-acetyl-beta-D-mannosaminyltransferase
MGGKPGFSGRQGKVPNAGLRIDFQITMHLPLKFWKGSARELLLELDTRGGYVVAPSAPSLCQSAREPRLWQAHLSADHAILDSGYLRILLFLCGTVDLPRISGLHLIEQLLALASTVIGKRKFLWVVPDQGEWSRIQSLLLAHGFPPDLHACYVAPQYRKEEEFSDACLLERVQEWEPDWVILCIGGGRQEKVGSHLRTEFGKRPVVLATGAAISFFSGGQVAIPTLADRAYLGWLVRILHEPRRFLPRYLQALLLPLAIWRLRSQPGG